MIKLFIIYLSLLVSFESLEDAAISASAQEVEEGYVIRDSILRELETYSLSAERWQKEKEAYLKNVSYPWAILFLEMALSDSREMSDTAGIAYCLYNLAVDAPDHGDTLTAGAALEEIQAMSDNTTARQYYFRLRTSLNNDMVMAYQFDKAVEDLDELEKEALRCGSGECKTIVDVGRILLLSFLEKYDEAEVICEEIISMDNVDFYEKLTAYVRLYEVYLYQEKYQESIEVLDRSMAYLTNEMAGDPLSDGRLDANCFLIESNYVLAYCALEDVEHIPAHIEGMKRYYIDSFMNTNYILYHYLCYFYYSLVKDWDSAEYELDRMVAYRIVKKDENGLRNTIQMRADVKYGRGQKDSACFYYQEYLNSQQAFYDGVIEQQRTNVQNNYLVKKAESDEQHMLTMVLCLTAILLFIGVLSFLKLYFNRSVKVTQEKMLTLELEQSYKAAEMLNKDSEMLLLRVRECISEPLDKVVRNVDCLSEPGLDEDRKKQILTEVTENAWNLNAIITDFLNRARTQVGKPAFE